MRGEQRHWGKKEVAFGAVNEEAWELTGVLKNEVFWKVVERWAVGSETVRGRREAPGKRGETVEGAKQSAWICRNGREHGGRGSLGRVRKAHSLEGPRDGAKAVWGVRRSQGVRGGMLQNLTGS